MDDDELIRRAKEGEIVGSGERAVEALCRRLATMEAAVRAADRLLDASDTTPTGERRYVGSITEDRETFCTAADLLEAEDSNDT